MSQQKSKGSCSNANARHCILVYVSPSLCGLHSLSLSLSLFLALSLSLTFARISCHVVTHSQCFSVFTFPANIELASLRLWLCCTPVPVLLMLLLHVSGGVLNAQTTPKRWGTAHESIVPYQVRQSRHSAALHQSLSALQSSCKWMNTRAYINTYMHTYTFIHTHILSSIRTHIQTNVSFSTTFMRMTICLTHARIFTHWHRQAYMRECA
jgi:hypothetical protein